MAEPRTDLMDDQRRRARRRLVGAAVLALAGAVIVPLFLESEPKPLGQDVQILIPAVEGSKFVNRFTAEADAAGKKLPPAVLPEPAVAGSDAKAPAAAAESPGKTAAQAGESVPPAAAGQPSSPGRAAEPAATVAAVAPAPKVKDGPPAAKAAPKAEPKSEPKPEVKSEATVSAKSADGDFVVQLGAYTDAKVAKDLLVKLKAAHFPAYAEVLDTSQGKLHRVRVGPYASRDKADAVRVVLKDKGHSGIVTPVR